MWICLRNRQHDVIVRDKLCFCGFGCCCCVFQLCFCCFGGCFCAFLLCFCCFCMLLGIGHSAATKTLPTTFGMLSDGCGDHLRHYSGVFCLPSRLFVRFLRVFLRRPNVFLLLKIMFVVISRKCMGLWTQCLIFHAWENVSEAF